MVEAEKNMMETDEQPQEENNEQPNPKGENDDEMGDDNDEDGMEEAEKDEQKTLEDDKQVFFASTKMQSPAEFAHCRPPRTYIARYTFRIKIEATPTSAGVDQLVRDGMVKAWGEFKKQDKHALMMPYKDSDHLKVRGRISHPNQIPVDIYERKKFFTRSYVDKDKGGDVYINALVGHTVPFDKIVTNMKPFLIDNKYGLFVKRLQSEEIYNVGWLLFSHGQVEADVLGNVLTKTLGFPVSVVWRMIAEKGKKAREIPQDEKVFALHVDIPADEHVEERKEALSELYSNTRRG
jgi:hypothetical protein